MRAQTQKFVFVHIPRSAGTTFEVMLSKYFHNIRRLNIKGSMFMMYDDHKRAQEIKRDGLFENRDVVYGHFPYQQYYYLKEKYGWNLITWIRDPIEQLISHYSWIHFRQAPDKVTELDRKVRGMSIEEFSRYSSNFYTRWTGRDPSVFDFIGVVEKFDESIETFNNQFNCELRPLDIRNANVWEKLEVSRNTRKELKQNHLKDYELYEKVIERYR